MIHSVELKIWWSIQNLCRNAKGQTTPDIRSKIIKNNNWLHGTVNIKFHSVPFNKTKNLVENVELVKFGQGQITTDRGSKPERVHS